MEERTEYKIGGDQKEASGSDTVERLVMCLGVDYLLHTCKPHENKTLCGVAIRKKKLDAHDKRDRFSCYQCTF